MATEESVMRRERSLTNVLLAAAMVMLCLLPAAMGFQQLSKGPQEGIVIDYEPACVDGAFNGAANQCCCDPTSMVMITNPRDVNTQADNIIEEVLAPKKHRAS